MSTENEQLLRKENKTTHYCYNCPSPGRQRKLIPLGPKDLPARCPGCQQIYTYAHRPSQRLEEMSL